MILTVLAAFVMSTATVEEPVCAPPSGVEQLWGSENTRFIFIGERHGTVEAPGAFGEIVCEAARTQPITVALELPSFLQADLDTYLASDGGGEARAALLANNFWTRVKDGRGSIAMISMIERVRALKAAGQDVAFAAFQPSRPNRPNGFGQGYYEIEMAEALSRAAQDRPDSLVLVLVGALHAAKSRLSSLDNSLAAAGHLPPSEVMSVNVALQGGEAWDCTQAPDGGLEPVCGPNSEITRIDSSKRGVSIELGGDSAFDGMLALGRSTASPPAVTDD
ncbi:hypothetical protein [Brevundimonas sp. SL130]|uniref:hypothetical protein n=1 Tax=Brevundimonas sp. SL130 TaxID=2995143 RepID=UPI00226D1826|nr:hypothetical protein [Brevundimonas sp. SL130]WAC58972.1 hypothetical protein OU998_12195 [Brevundimonas sp. SL130]